jgi:hypothetical protein
VADLVQAPKKTHRKYHVSIKAQPHLCELQQKNGFDLFKEISGTFIGLNYFNLEAVKDEPNRRLSATLGR